MKLRCLGSGSSGNCYLLENDTECLVLDAGIPIMEVKKALDFNISKISGVVCSHGHLDHLLSLNDFLKIGVPVYKPYEGGNQRFSIKKFKIYAFNVPHDGTENRGFLIEHPDIGKLLYLTDLEYCRYKFTTHNVNHILCEANYDMNFVDKDKSNYEHVLRGHMSLETALEFISTNDNPNLKTVCLIHLSESNSDEKYFLQKIKETVKYGADCYIADKGLQIDLVNKDICPFI